MVNIQIIHSVICTTYMDILSSRMKATMWHRCNTFSELLLEIWVVEQDKQRSQQTVVQFLSPPNSLLQSFEKSDRWNCLVLATLDFGSKIWVLASRWLLTPCVILCIRSLFSNPSIYASLLTQVFPHFCKVSIFPDSSFLFSSMEINAVNCPIAWANAFCNQTTEFCPLLAWHVLEVFFKEHFQVNILRTTR